MMMVWSLLSELLDRGSIALPKLPSSLSSPTPPTYLTLAISSERQGVCRLCRLHRRQPKPSFPAPIRSARRNGLCAVGFMDDHYPVRSAFSLLNEVLDEYQKMNDLLNTLLNTRREFSEGL
ncbi:unnamed protein product [Microthlaspi erraticum]|uniref:Longin domain-containing protein n=1 Tax=Microthlaspi erraticum TaxID=1685480 RepID=A0A6D2J092_9BRAS|nr:unnamed protein product [Microthlaspi erraticum]